MNGKFGYVLAIVMLCVFQLKTAVNLNYGTNTKKEATGPAESTEGKEEKTEKENYNEKAGLAIPARVTGRLAAVMGAVNGRVTNSHLLLAAHFFAVPTPPPWQ